MASYWKLETYIRLEHGEHRFGHAGQIERRKVCGPHFKYVCVCVCIHILTYV
jgi:hypothetical protein